jgi:hypothetical protein
MRYPEQPRRPVLVTWVAVFHLIFGGLGLLCVGGVIVTLATGVGKSGGPPPANENPQQKAARELQERVQARAETEAPWEKALSPYHTAANLLLVLLLVVAGVGLLQMRKWGWWASVAFGVLCLLMQIYLLLFDLLYRYPAESRILEEELQAAAAVAPVPGFVAMALRARLFVPAGLAALFMLYPLIVLLVMILPSVRAAFRGEFPHHAAMGYDGGRGPDGAPPGAGYDPAWEGYGGEAGRPPHPGPAAPEDRPEAPH